MSLAGIHYPDTTEFFGDLGITDVTDQLADRGLSVEGWRLYMADHYRATVDMVVGWVLSNSDRCNVEVDEWFPSAREKQRLLNLLDTGKSQLQEVGKLEKVKLWLSSQ